MLGAEGVKSLVVARLAEVLPKALAVRRHVVGASVAELPEVAGIHPTPAVEEPVGGWPFLTVHVDDTPGEISNQAPPPGSDDIVQEFQLEYNLIVGVNAWSSAPGVGGELAARLQAERIALACREALLQNRMLQAPAAGAEYADWCEVNYARWVEDYDTFRNDAGGGWMGAAALKVPVLAHEFLDRAPYLDNRMFVVTSLEVSSADPVTGVVFPETVVDPVDGAPYPRPE